MAMSLRDWSKSIGEIKKLSNDHPEQMWSEKFLRDPFRKMVIDERGFYAPADGIILYQDVYKPTEKIVEIKGMHYSLQDIMDDQTFNKECLVIGIFMTMFDVHVNRLPHGAVFTYKMLTPTTSYNKPMIFMEKDLADVDIVNLYNTMNYVKTNGRMLNTFYIPYLDYRYYITQIADNEVNSITHFTTAQYIWFNQGDRFSVVRWGSQVELILPIDKRYNFKTLVPNLFHVEAGQDKLVTF